MMVTLQSYLVLPFQYGPFALTNDGYNQVAKCCVVQELHNWHDHQKKTEHSQKPLCKARMVRWNHHQLFCIFDVLGENGMHGVARSVIWVEESFSVGWMVLLALEMNDEEAFVMVLEVLVVAWERMEKLEKLAHLKSCLAVPFFSEFYDPTQTAHCLQLQTSPSSSVFLMEIHQVL